jgi:hypothetical protein
MISDILSDAEVEIGRYLVEFPDAYPPNRPTTARIEALVVLMGFVRADLDCPPDADVPASNVVASLRSLASKVDSTILPIAEQIRGVFEAHRLTHEASPSPDLGKSPE